MITKEFMDYFVEKFKYCFDLDNKWNHRIFSNNDENNLADLFYERSNELRDSFNLNEEIIGELKLNIHDDLSEEEADILYNAVMDLYYTGYDDFIVLEIVFIPLTTFFRKTYKLDKLIPLLHAFAYEESEFYIESNYTNNTESLRYFYEIFRYQNDYPSVKDKKARMCFMKAYCNLISSLTNLIETDIMQYFQVRKRALGFWDSRIVQKIDGNDPEFYYYVDRLSKHIFTVNNINLLPAKVIDVIKITLDKYQTSKRVGEIYYSNISNTIYKLQYFDKRITVDELLTKLIEIYNKNYNRFKRLPLEEDETNDYLENCENTIKDIISYYSEDISDELKLKIKKLIGVHKKLLISIPYDYRPQEINRSVYEYYRSCHNLLGSFDEKLDFILKDMMYRQPFTCIHSIMVKNISEIIAEGVFDHKPELYVGVLGTKDLNDVLENKDKIIQFVKNAALLHDVGKFACANIINKQNRRLDDREFKIIKTHPDNARVVLCNDSDFDDYYDIMEGHHKYYDGSFGYPSNFDNVHSKNRFIIDLITISDSTDAATDVLGRNYVKGKLFVDLLSEFQRESGTRYNPDIVDIISNDLVLIDDLSKVTTRGRLEVYEYVYKKYIKE